MNIADILIEKTIVQAPQNPHLFAQVAETPDGVHVKFFRRTGGNVRLIDQAAFQVPFHVVLDHVHEILASASPVAGSRS